MTVTFKIDMEDDEAALLAACLGKAHNLKDEGDKELGVEPQPRAATQDEVTEFFIARGKQVVVDIKGPELEAIAKAAIVMPRFDPKVSRKA